jgi:gamma-glutamyl-gamma-aminobutyrate hydrolase PuuD
VRLVAITQRVERAPAPHDERRDQLDQRWSTLLQCCGFQLYPLPNRIERVDGALAALPLHAVILSGGGDLGEYGGEAPERDRTECELLEHALARGIPALGVCRGMQRIQHRFGTALEPVAGHMSPALQIRVRGERRCVNSYHRLGARHSAPPLCAWAHADDGVIKAVSHCELPVHGIMWHPEREDPPRREDLALLCALLRPTGARS